MDVEYWNLDETKPRAKYQDWPYSFAKPYFINWSKIFSLNCDLNQSLLLLFFFFFLNSELIQTETTVVYFLKWLNPN